MDHDSQVDLLIKQFQCVDPDYKFPDKLDIETQKKIYFATVDDAHHVWFPVNRYYQLKFLNAFIEKSKKENVPYDNLIQLMADLMEMELNTNTQFRHYVIEKNSLSPRLMIEESMMLVKDGTIGLKTWEADTVLAEWCVADPSRVKDKKIVELGCKGGLTGLTILNLTKPKQYTFTYNYCGTWETLKGNLEFNLNRMKLELGKTVNYFNFEWDEIDQDPDADWKKPDIVIASDVVHNPDLFPDLIRVFSRLLKHPDSFGVIGITVRNEETISTFLNALGEHDLEWKEEDLPTPSIFLKPKLPVRIIKIHKSAESLKSLSQQLSSVQLNSSEAITI